MIERFSGTIEMTKRARFLRQQRSAPGRIFWTPLSRAQLGCSFRRQYPVGPYTLDFYCAPSRLAIEVDGGMRACDDQALRDALHDEYFEQRGAETIRFWARDVLFDLVTGVKAIYARLHDRARLLSLALQGQGGGRCEEQGFGFNDPSPDPSHFKGGEKPWSISDD